MFVHQPYTYLFQLITQTNIFNFDLHFYVSFHLIFILYFSFISILYYNYCFILLYNVSLF